MVIPSSGVIIKFKTVIVLDVILDGMSSVAITLWKDYGVKAIRVMIINYLLCSFL